MNGRFMLAVIHYPDEQELPFSFVSWNLRTSIPQLKPFVYQNTLYILKNNSENEKFCHIPDSGGKNDFPEKISGTDTLNVASATPFSH